MKRTFQSMDAIKEFSSRKLNRAEIRKKFGEKNKQLSDQIIDLLSK